ncbi:hypothetical protein AB0I84_15735 [Streptomyces spectabilis]|uniref:hypothetical protein n=1 Tax=Streptomyces spectabilis TaxID=68270 RepID=UPI0033D67C05
MMLLDFDPLVTEFSSQPFWLGWRATERAAAGRMLRTTDCRPADRIDQKAAESFDRTRETCDAVGWA